MDGGLLFGQWLDRMMRERGISHRMLALLSGVDHSTISRLKRGQRCASLATAEALCQALGRTYTIGRGPTEYDAPPLTDAEVTRRRVSLAQPTVARA